MAMMRILLEDEEGLNFHLVVRLARVVVSILQDQVWWWLVLARINARLMLMLMILVIKHHSVQSDKHKLEASFG